MKGDFTRQTFRRRNHYRGVLLQQGRAVLDADWNEQVFLQSHRDQVTALDTVGAHGAPQDAAGMRIVGGNGQPPAGPVAATELWIAPGRYYVGGVVCENDRPVPLTEQPDLPDDPLEDLLPGKYTAYLDVWSEHLTARERPRLREVALGGPDTTTRARTVWQVRVRSAEADPPPALGAGRLRARAKAVGEITDACDAPTGTGYRRLDNQLYRVEIHNGDDADEAMFLWSRENGSVTARLVALDGNVLTLDSIGRDDRLAFDKGWVEVTSRSRVLRGERSFVGSIGHVQDTTVTVAGWSDGAAPTLDDLGEDPIVRRWESGPILVTLPANADDWISLESGVQIQFADAVFRRGNYWLIPARTANLEGTPPVAGLAGDVDWPQDDAGPAFALPAGIQHYYADIADLERGDDGWTVTDRRPVFPPLTRLTGDIDVGYAGGDGQQVAPGSPLPQPLEVSVTRRGTAVPGAVVRFEAADDDGRLAATAAELPASAVHALDVPTDPDGVAHCWWRPADDPERPGQRVTARWIGPDGQPVEPRVDFSAAFTVDEGLGVIGARLMNSGTPLPNDAPVGAADLAGGVAVVLPTHPDLAIVTGKPVLTVTLDIPYPLSEADRTLWGTTVIGTTPVTVAGDVGTAEFLDGSAVTWAPAEPSQQWLQTLVGSLVKLEAGKRVLGHLALDGRVTGRADWHQWFWLVEAVVNLLIMPHPAGRLRLRSGRQLIAHAVNPNAIRAALPPGARIADTPDHDLEAARRNAGNAFRRGAARRLTLVAAGPYVAAAEVIREALAGVDVQVDVVSAADPVAEVSARLAAAQPVDGILTDDSQQAAMTAALPEFLEGFPL